MRLEILATHLSALRRLLLYQKKMDESLRLALDILERDPQNYTALINVSVIYFEKRDWKNAATYLKKANNLKPHDKFVREALQKLPAEFQKT